MYTNKNRQSFISLQEHNANFQNNQQCRLLNPKYELGKVSKKILLKIINIDREKTKFNQWKNTTSVNLLIESLSVAETFEQISDDERKIILRAKQAFLFDQDLSFFIYYSFIIKISTTTF